MRIAILMSTYNGHKYLDKQLKSIAEQTLIAIKYRLISSKVISDMNNKELRSFKARIILNLY